MPFTCEVCGDTRGPFREVPLMDPPFICKECSKEIDKIYPRKYKTLREALVVLRKSRT